MKPIKNTSEPPDRDRLQGCHSPSVEFRSGLNVLKGRSEMPKLTTGSADLDSLLGGGIEPGHFYLFYGDNESGVDFLIHQVLLNCLLPKEKCGFDGKAVYSNCGNYREEKTLLDSQLLSFQIKAARLDPVKALEDIYVICAFSEEQQEQTVVEIQKLLKKDEKIKLVAVHNLAKLFTSTTGTANKNFGEKIPRLQNVVFKLWQTCSQKNIAFVASCRPNKTSRGRIPQPEGGDVAVSSSGSSTITTPSYCPIVTYEPSHFPPIFSTAALAAAVLFGLSLTFLIPCSVQFQRTT